MTDDTQPAETPKRARRAPGKPSSELAKRRAERKARRDNYDQGHDKRLTLGGADLDLGNYQYRWVNDETGRIKRMESVEWEVVSEDELNGLSKDRHAGLTREGGPMNTVLMKKYKDWFTEDQDEKLRESREVEDALKRGSIATNDPEGGHDYAVQSNSITSATPTKRASAG